MTVRTAGSLRMDGVTHYGCDPVYERICTEPKEPLCFFNMEGHPGATLLIWEHTLDSNGKRCSNPRAIVPRWDVPAHRQGAGRD